MVSRTDDPSCDGRAVWELVDIERMVSGRGRTLNYPALEAHLTAIQEQHRTGPDDEAL